jgi:hypothetical protein
MMFGLMTITFVQVVLSLIGIFSGFVVAYGLLTAKRLDRRTSLFLTTTVLTSATGFFLLAEQLMPSHAIGILSLVVLALAIIARYVHQLHGGWRRTYAMAAVISSYFNVFVLIAQLSQNVPELKAMAPTQSAPHFLVAQLACLPLFVALGILAAIRFRSGHWGIGALSFQL